MYRIFLLLALLSSAAQPALAQSDLEPSLRVGVKVAPPFVMKDESGAYSGISIALWERVAARIGRDYVYQETDLAGLFNGLEQGRFDASVAALTVTASRESMVDFSHSFHSTGLAIAVPEKGNAVLSIVKGLFSLKFLMTLAALAGVLALVGFLLWLAERKGNQAMFGGTPSQGIGSSFWWAAVTMTTVGYGDKAPVTFWGRMIALIWMFTAIIIISSFTAAIATSLTVGRLESSVRGVDDLRRVRVASVSGSISDDFLSARGIRFARLDDVEHAVAGLAKGEYDAVVYDKPILQYVASREFPKRTRVLPNTFARQNYAIALPDQSALREQINQALLNVTSDESWQSVLNRYLGADN